MAFAQPGEDRYLTLNMPMSHYRHNEEVVIEGKVRPLVESEAISIVVYRPDGSAILEDSIIPTQIGVLEGVANGEYRYTFVVSEEPKTQGDYLVSLRYGNQHADVTFYYDNLPFSALESPYKLKWKGEEYEIPFEFEGTRRIEDMRAYSRYGWDSTIFLILRGSETQDNDSLEITLPLALINKVFGYAINLTYTNDYRVPNYVTSYDKITATLSTKRSSIGVGYAEPQYLIPKQSKGCESVTWVIDVPSDADRIDLSLNGWGFIPEAFPFPVESSKYPFRWVVASDDGDAFRLDMLTNANSCSFYFIQEEKRIQINVTTPKTEPQGYILINVPERLIGGNYTVMVDQREVDSFRVLGSSNEFSEFTKTAEVINAIEIDYEKNARTIEIIGTTAIPEFGTVVILILASVIGFMTVSARWLKSK